MRKVFFNRALWVFHVNTGSCNACDIEIIAALTPRYDVERFGIKLVGSPRHTDVLLVTGPVTKPMEPILKRIYDQTPDPKAVIVVGNCGTHEGVFYNSYNIVGSIDKVVPVAVYVPGCPPRPEAIIYGVVKAVQLLEDVKVVEEVVVKEPTPSEREIEVYVEYKEREKVPELAVSERIDNFNEVVGVYDKEAARREALRCLQCPDPAPCVEACPAGVNAKKYIDEISKDLYKEAFGTNLEKLTIPATCGRVCPHPCEEACTRSGIEKPIAIRALKRFVSDWGMTEVKDGWYPKVEPQNKGRIAVIGSGPAGLTVARNLALDGYEVKIFDHSVIGGMLTQSIPDFRLPPEVPQREIEEVKKLGITIENGHLGSDFTLKDLLEEYSAVFLSIGAHKDQMMRIPGEDLDGVYQALHFLKDIKQGKKISFEGKKVIVVGGGNVAMDVARTARRLKGEVKIVYRRAWEQMPADEEEIRGAEEEGVEFNLLVNPVEILGKGKVEGIRCIRMELGEPDESGRRRPVPIKGSEFEMEADIFIEAIGEVPEGDKLEPMGLKVTSWGSIEVDENMRTNIEGVFAAGDAVTGAATVIEAVAGAIKAAEAIKEYCEKRRRLVRA